MYPKYPCINTLKGNKIRWLKKGLIQGNIEEGEITDLEFENHKNIKEKLFFFFPSNRTSWDKSLFNGIQKHKFYHRSELVQLPGKYTEQSTHCAVPHLLSIYLWLLLKAHQFSMPQAVKTA